MFDTHFSEVKEIYVGNRTITYRAYWLDKKQVVVLKTLRADYPTSKELASLQYEYELTKEQKIPGVIHTYDLFRDANKYVLVMEDIGGITLKEFIGSKKLSLDDFFKIALQLI